MFCDQYSRNESHRLQHAERRLSRPVLVEWMKKNKRGGEQAKEGSAWTVKRRLVDNVRVISSEGGEKQLSRSHRVKGQW